MNTLSHPEGLKVILTPQTSLFGPESPNQKLAFYNFSSNFSPTLQSLTLPRCPSYLTGLLVPT